MTECAMTLNNSYGLIISPASSWPGWDPSDTSYYYNNIDCTWLIQRENEELIELNFISFGIACCAHHM